VSANITKAFYPKYESVFTFIMWVGYILCTQSGVRIHPILAKMSSWVLLLWQQKQPLISA